MIALYYQSEAQIGPRLRHQLAGRSALLLRDREQFSRLRARASCAVLLVEQLCHDPAFADLNGARPSPHTTVLATRRDPENLRLLGSALVDEVVWIEDVGHALLPAIDRAQESSYLRRAAQAIRASKHIPGRLRAALVHACQAPEPVRSVHEVAAAAGCDRSTLSRQWNRTVPPGSALRLQDFLDWIMILRAAARRTPGRKWSAIATELGTWERSLGRRTARLTGWTLRGLDRESNAEVVRLFEERALGHLTAHPMQQNVLKSHAGTLMSCSDVQ